MGRRAVNFLHRHYVRPVVRNPKKCAAGWMVVPLLLAVIGFWAWPFEIETAGSGFYPRSTYIAEAWDALVEAELATTPDPAFDFAAYEADEKHQQEVAAYTVTVLYRLGDLGTGDVISAEKLAYIRGVEDMVSQRADWQDYCWRPQEGGPCSPVQSLNMFTQATPLGGGGGGGGGGGYYLADGGSSAVIQPVDTTKLALITPEDHLAGPPPPGGRFCRSASPANVTASCAVVEARPSALDGFVAANFGWPNNAYDPDTAPDLTSYVTRSAFVLGLPLAGYKSPQDREEEQEAKCKQYVLDVINTPISALDEEEDGMRVLLTGDFVDDENINGIIQRDGMLTMFSIAVVVLIMWFHTSSFFLASLGMLHIVMSFPLAYFFTQLFLDVGKTGMLQFMSLIIIIGIGADDCFILVDAWKQSSHEIARPQRVPRIVRDKCPGKSEEELVYEEWLVARLEWTFHRAASAMLITSVTSSAAFFINVLSPIPPIRVFGFFTGCMTIVNYVLVITYYPCVVIAWERWVRPLQGFCALCCPCADQALRQLPCCSCCFGRNAGSCQNTVGSEGATETPAPPSATVAAASKNGKEGSAVVAVQQPGALTPSAAEAGYDAGDPAIEVVGRSHRLDPDSFGPFDTRENINDFRPLERFFYRRWADGIWRGRFLVAFVSVVVFALSLAYAVQLASSDEAAEFIPKNHPVGMAFDLKQNAFKRGEEVQNVFLVFGMDARQPIDRTGTNPNRAGDDEKGEPVFSADWDRLLAREAGQQAMLRACEAARTGPKVRDEEALCAMGMFRDYMLDGSKNANLTEGIGFPCPEQYFAAKFQEFASWQLSQLNVSPDGGVQEKSFGQSVSATFPSALLFDQTTNRLLAITIPVNLTVPNDETAERTQQTYDAWQAVVDRLARDEGALLGVGYQSSIMYVGMKTEQVLVYSAWQGIIVSLAMAFVLLVLFTHGNILLATIATFNICSVVFTLMALMVAIGWELGIIESICLTILVGLSVDYVIHLCHAFNESIFRSRFQRMQDALTVIGISILSAGLTTFASAVVMFFCVVIFFERFGQFIAITVALSALQTFFPFTAWCMILGPLGRQGDLRVLFEHCGLMEAKQPAPLRRGKSALEEGQVGAPVEAKRHQSEVEMTVVSTDNAHDDLGDDAKPRRSLV